MASDQSNFLSPIAIDSRQGILFAKPPDSNTSNSTDSIARINPNLPNNIPNYNTPDPNFNVPFKGSVSAMTIDPKRSINYVPAPGFNGIDQFFYKATDGSTDTSNQPYINPLNFPNNYNQIQGSVFVIVNDSPVLDNSGNPSLNTLKPNEINSGTLISELIDRLGGTKITDPNDAISLRPRGVAITAADTTNGSWQYTTDGTNWTNFAFTAPGTAQNPLLLPSNPTTRIRLIPS